MPITDLLRNDGDNPFVTGDCFQFEFSDVSEYEDKKPGHYWPIVDEATVCEFNVDATCARIDKFQYKVTLNAGTTTLTGTIGKIKNPYSVLPNGLKLIEIRYYAGCTSETPSDSTTNEMQDGYTLGIEVGIIPVTDVDFTVTRQIVGDAERTNVATFTFTPKTKLSSLGGSVRISAPNWYDSEKKPEVAFGEKNFECASRSFQTISKQRKNTKRFTVNG
jgi:hypothetical protein